MTLQRPTPALDCRRWHADLLRLIAEAPGEGELASAAGLDALAGLAARLPAGLGDAIDGFRRSSNLAGALVLDGLPHEDPGCPTPTTRARPPRRGRVGSGLAGLIASRLGAIVGYAQLDDGALFRDVYPLPDETLEQSARGSRAPLDLHTEHAFHAHRPRFVLLLGLRGGPAVTLSVGLDELLGALSPADVALLSRPLFRTGIDYAFGNRTTLKGNGPIVSVLGDAELRYDADLMLGLTDEAALALERLRHACHEVARGAELAPGRLLIVDNRRAAHGRTAFTARFDGSDRWLLQIKTMDVVPPTGRVIDTRF